MSELRRLSTRNRGEPPLKKRALSPPSPTVPALPRTPTEPSQEGLPLKLKEGRPLPTFPDRQDPNLSAATFQTISESGVLAASIERSRQKWLTNGPFERYWTKPSKKKDMGTTPNPAKETMTRLGVCSMIIDPHVFEVTLYTVKELPTSHTPIPAPVQPPSLSAPQYNPFTPSRPYAPPSYNAPVPYPPYQASKPSHPSQQSLPPFHEGFGSFGPQCPPPPIHHPPIPPLGPSNTSQVGNTTQTATQGENSEPDPVIQMLATRAASDPRLKTLMKVVASGKAAQQQLREFQDHIDELNSILKSRSSPNNVFGLAGSTEPPRHVGQEHAAQYSHIPTKPDVFVNQTGSPGTYSAPHHAATPIKVETPAQSHPMAIMPPVTKATNNSKTDIDGVCFDFGGTGDRYSIPRFSILEYLYGGTQVIVSFIVVRPGNTAASGNYKGTKSYYQPVTIRLTSPHPRVLEPLARAVAPPDEVRKYMNEFFDRLSPANIVHLAIRLPRTSDSENAGTQEVPAQADAHPTGSTYSPPNAIMPLAA